MQKQYIEDDPAHNQNDRNNGRESKVAYDGSDLINNKIMTQSSKNLNSRQLEAVAHADGPLLIAAGAGSGKTKTLTTRLAKLIERGIKPEHIVAITFTNKAAKEMADRVSANPAPFIGTFHSFCARILKQEAKLVNRTQHYTIFDDDDSMSLLKKVMKQLDISKDRYSPVALHSKISQIKSELLDPKEFDKTAALVFEKYELELLKNNAFDFDDLIEKTVRILQDHPAVLKKYHQQFTHILVDEYQDINTCQYQLIRLLAGTAQNLSVVGDDQQAIYSFRGADFRNFLNFQRDWPNAKIVKLEQNYRSTANIINAASAVIKNNKLQTPKTLWTDAAAGSLIRVVKTTDPEQEAAVIAGRLYEHKPESAAILYRTNAQSRSIEQALIAANIPYKIFGGLKFYERKEVKDLVAGLRIANNPLDSISAERLRKNFDKKTGAHLVAELTRLGKNLSILELINFFLENSNYFEYLEKHYKNHLERVENINELIRFAGDFKSLDEFLERVSLLQSADAAAKSSGNGRMPPVNLMSVHLAKGLEFDHVFVSGCTDGLLPHQMSYGSLDEIEEERRLMYVAMTRARKELCLTFSGTPSRFLYEIPPELTDFVDLDNGKKELPDADDMYIDYN